MIDDVTTTAAAPEEVWKLLYDPARFTEWWAGIEAVNAGDDRGGEADITFYPDGYPDFPMPQHLTTDQLGGSVQVSCTVSEVVWQWRLVPLDAGGTEITVHADIGENDAHRLDGLTAMAQASLHNLARAATGAPPGSG